MFISTSIEQEKKFQLNLIQDGKLFQIFNNKYLSNLEFIELKQIFYIKEQLNLINDFVGIFEQNSNDSNLISKQLGNQNALIKYNKQQQKILIFLTENSQLFDKLQSDEGLIYVYCFTGYCFPQTKTIIFCDITDEIILNNYDKHIGIELQTRKFEILKQEDEQLIQKEIIQQYDHNLEQILLKQLKQKNNEYQINQEYEFKIKQLTKLQEQKNIDLIKLDETQKNLIQANNQQQEKQKDIIEKKLIQQQAQFDQLKNESKNNKIKISEMQQSNVSIQLRILEESKIKWQQELDTRLKTYKERTFFQIILQKHLQQFNLIKQNQNEEEKYIQLQNQLQNLQDNFNQIENDLQQFKKKLNDIEQQKLIIQQIGLKQNKLNKKICIICQKYYSEYLHLPCGHLIYCEQCKINIYLENLKCTVCEKKVHKIQKVNFKSVIIN